MAIIRIDSVLAGLASVTAVADGFADTTRTVDLLAGHTATRDFTLSPGQSSGRKPRTTTEKPVTTPTPPQSPEGPDGWLSMILQFLYTLSTWLGQLIVAGIQSILPTFSASASLANTIGLLAILTIVMAITEVAKKIAWIVVGVGWFLVVVRVALVVIQGQEPMPLESA